MVQHSRLKQAFFSKDAEEAAFLLLGKSLVHKLKAGYRFGIIVETEAYIGRQDKASHAYGGRRTAKTETMFGKAGLAYVYFTYGMHWMLNIVTGKVGDPQAVLIRGLDTVSGPGRLTKAFKIDKSLNGEDLVVSDKLWVEDWGFRVPRTAVGRTARIGVDYAGEWKDKPLRFVLKPDYLGKIAKRASIYRVVSMIPEGKVATYKYIADKAFCLLKTQNQKLQARITPRNVGQALHSNPNPEIIPCHRVVDTKGCLSQNFAFGGAQRQRLLLLKEGVKFKGRFVVEPGQLWQKR